MRKEKKRTVGRIVSMMLTLLLICTFPLPTMAEGMTADEYEQAKLEAARACIEGREHDHSLCITTQTNPCHEAGGIQTRGTCAFCGNWGAEFCNQDAIEDSRGTHSYSGGTCTVVYLKSSAFIVCEVCFMRSALWDEESNPPRLAYHYCWEVHQNCGRGNYHVCPVGYYPS